MHRHRNGLRNLFVSDEWHTTSFSTSVEGQLVENIVLSMPFWHKVENCLRASQPLLIALRIADGDETPAAPEIMAAMDVAKTTIKDSLKDKPRLLAEVLECYEKRWESQMEQKLYGAALYLNPGKFFAIREKDRRQAARLRSMFNDVLWKMVSDDDEQTKISKQADDYERSEGDSFSKQGAIRDRDRKNPSKDFETIPSVLPFLFGNELTMELYICIAVLWWGSYGGLEYELQSLAKRIISLCCSASGCERNWSAFANVSTTTK
uniref:HAT C-terminal dimerisation domain-containing protein n=1 Tax=Arundo donax TaxID=35708 RepID=A0A0A9CSM2_ARUDO